MSNVTILTTPEEVADVLGFDPRSGSTSGGYKVLCVSHKDRNPSLVISAGDNGAILAQCWVCNPSGKDKDAGGAIRRAIDAAALEANCRINWDGRTDDERELDAQLEAEIEFDGVDPDIDLGDDEDAGEPDVNEAAASEPKKTSKQKRQEKAEAAKAKKAEDDEAQLAFIEAQLKGSEMPAGNAAGVYLARRGIDLKKLEAPGFQLPVRWFPALEIKTKAGGTRRCAAMLTPIIRPADGSMCAVMLTYLTSDGQKDERVFPGGRQFIGPKSEGFARIGASSANATRIVLGEGLETVLSAAMIDADSGSHASTQYIACLGGVQKPPVGPKVREVVILVDRDVEDRHGILAREIAIEHDIPVTPVTVPDAVMRGVKNADLNDMLRAIGVGRTAEIMAGAKRGLDHVDPVYAFNFGAETTERQVAQIVCDRFYRTLEKGEMKPVAFIYTNGAMYVWDKDEGTYSVVHSDTARNSCTRLLWGSLGVQDGKYGLISELDKLARASANTTKALLAAVDYDEDVVRNGRGWLRRGIAQGNARDWMVLKDGLFNIRTKQSIDFTPDYFAQSRLSFSLRNYAELGEPAAFLKFLGEVCADDPPRVRLIRELMAYLLSGSNAAQRFFLVVGTAGSGKSTLREVISALFGNAANETSVDAMSSKFGLSPLVGKLVTFNSDLTDNSSSTGKVALENLKKVTGGDPAQIEAKFKDGYTAVLETRFVLIANKTPSFLTDESKAIDRRAVCVPFPVSVPEDQRDPNLRDKLLAELPEIAKWALEALPELEQSDWKFSEPESAKVMREEFVEVTQRPLSFILDRVVTTQNSGAWLSLQGWYDHYVEWCRRSGIRAVTKPTFKASFTSSLRDELRLMRSSLTTTKEAAELAALSDGITCLELAVESLTPSARARNVVRLNGTVKVVRRVKGITYAAGDSLPPITSPIDIDAADPE